MTKTEQIKKHGLTDVFDQLYANSKNKDNGNRLFGFVMDDRNLNFALEQLQDMSWMMEKPLPERLSDVQIQSCRNYLQAYSSKVDLFYTLLIEQAIAQVLEPWCEARFHPHNYSGRPERCSYHALSRFMSLINVGKMYYAVRLDFDVLWEHIPYCVWNHALWNIGIHDKRLLSVLARILRDGRTGMTKPVNSQLKTLLETLVLNELDWWVSSQWETLKVNGNLRYVQKKDTNLKSGYLIRYGSEMRILCRSYTHAKRWTYALEDFLTHRFQMTGGYTVTVVNLKKQTCPFVDFSIDVVQKGTARYGYVGRSYVQKECLDALQRELKQLLKTLQYHRTKRNVCAFNQKVRWAKLRYQFGTHVYCDFDVLGGNLSASMRTRLSDCRTVQRYGQQTKAYQKENPGLRPDTKITVMAGIPLFVINAIKRRNPMNFPQARTIYSAKGRSVKLQ